jgi:DNA-binding IclR family transcriptional regulator
VGQRVPHNTTALGRAYLAATPEEMREQKVERICSQLEPGLRERLSEEIHRSLRNYDRHGFVFSFGDWDPDIFAAGVPLVSADRTRIMSLSCSGAIFDMTRKRLMTEIGPRMVGLRDQIYQVVQGVF